jgi:hypothetical protein
LTLPADLLYYAETVAKGDYLGEFEQIVLIALLNLGKNAYGARSNSARAVAFRSARSMPPGNAWKPRAVSAPKPEHALLAAAVALG